MQHQSFKEVMTMDIESYDKFPLFHNQLIVKDLQDGQF